MGEQKVGGSTETPKALSQGSLDRYLLIIVSVLMTAFVLILVGYLGFQLRNYGRGIEASLRPGDPLGHSALITYARSLDFAVVKISSVFMGIMLVFIGALYLLRVAEAAYSLGVQTGEVKTSLQTSSPGLVLATLGVVCVLFALYDKSTITFDQSPAKENAPPNKTAEASPTPLIFARGATVLSENELKKIESVCQNVKSHGIDSVTVEGFGDPGESEEFNLGLADRRNAYIRNLLSQRCSSGPQIRVTSYGKERPAGVAGDGQVIIGVDK
jgi:hypothetical protein